MEEDFLYIRVYLKLEVPFLHSSLTFVVFCQTSLWILSMHLLTGPVSHEQKLSQSLEIALTSTLGSLPSFTARLTRGQLQHEGTRETSTSWRAVAGSGKVGPAHLLGAREWDAGPSSGALWTFRPSCLAPTRRPGGEPVSLLFHGELRGCLGSLTSEERLYLVVLWAWFPYCVCVFVYKIQCYSFRPEDFCFSSVVYFSHLVCLPSDIWGPLCKCEV